MSQVYDLPHASIIFWRLAVALSAAAAPLRVLFLALHVVFRSPAVDTADGGTFVRVTSNGVSCSCQDTKSPQHVCHAAHSVHRNHIITHTHTHIAERAVEARHITHRDNQSMVTCYVVTQNFGIWVLLCFVIIAWSADLQLLVKRLSKADNYLSTFEHHQYIDEAHRMSFCKSLMFILGSAIFYCGG